MERNDHAEAVKVRDIFGFRSKLDEMQQTQEDRASMQVITMLYPTLNHYNTFASRISWNDAQES
jgi:hypothetical protein